MDIWVKKKAPPPFRGQIWKIRAEGAEHFYKENSKGNRAEGAKKIPYKKVPLRFLVGGASKWQTLIDLN